MFRLVAVPGAAFALFLTGGGMLLAPSPAQAACTCVTATPTENAAEADAVFSGTVRESRNSRTDSGNDGGRQKGIVTYVVDVDRVWQQEGTVVTGTVQVSSARDTATCGLGDLPAGSMYVFFAKARDAGFRAGSCGGSAPISDDFRAEVEDALGSGKAMVPDEENPELVLTQVEESRPQTIGRLAAPGAAVALVGLLGLVFVRLVGSRR